MGIKDFLNFIRWKNILMLVLIQVLIKYVLFTKFDTYTFLDDFHFFILILSTIFIAASGYIINDIYDIKADAINKPEKVYVGNKISLKKSNNLYFILNMFGLILGLYLSYYIENISFFIIYIIISFLLYRYAIYLKKRFLIGNLTISILIFLSIIIVAIFDLVPATNDYNQQGQLLVFLILVKIASFAFILTLLREIIKDIEDIEGDKKINSNTIPIALGIDKTKNIIILIAIAALLGLVYFASTYYESNKLIFYYLLFLVALPLLYFMVKIKSVHTKEKFNKLSNLLKIIMLIGILTILLL
ncbi:MAG: geranylgeranylglycerol-phosphate geranylgeranyltransferase [Bacteroidota bacterium]